MKLDNEFTVGVPIDQAWAVLTDLELIAPCMPGAQLTGVNDGVYTGKVKIKVGPITAEYAGTAEFAEKDEAAYRAVIDARGRDSRGQGNATASISAQLRTADAGTVVTVDTDLALAGRIAQFGSGMIKEVSARLLGQFVVCLEQRLDELTPAGSTSPIAEALDGAAGDVAAEAAASGAAEAAGSGAAEAPASGAAEAAGSGAAEAPATAGQSPDISGQNAGPGQAAAVAAEPEPLNLMSVAGSAIYKRAAPVAVAIVVVIAVIIWLIVR